MCHIKRYIKNSIKIQNVENIRSPTISSDWSLLEFVLYKFCNNNNNNFKTLGMKYQGKIIIIIAFHCHFVA